MRFVSICLALLLVPVGAAAGQLAPITSIVDIQGQKVRVVSVPTVSSTQEGTRLGLDMDLGQAVAALPRLINGVHKDEQCGERIALSDSSTRVFGGELLVEADVDYAMRVCAGSGPAQSMSQSGRATLALKPQATGQSIRLAGRVVSLKFNGGLQGLEGLVKPALDAYLAHELAKADNAVALPPEVQALNPQISELKLLDQDGTPKLHLDAGLSADPKQTEVALRKLLTQ